MSEEPATKKARAKKEDPAAAAPVGGESETVRVVAIRGKTFMSFDEVEIPVGTLTCIAGRNASGKTSLSELVKVAVGGGFPADLVRRGAEQAEVGLVFENGDEARKIIDAEGGGRLELRRGTTKLSAPQGQLDSRFDGITLDLMRFALPTSRGGKDADRIAALLEKMDVTLMTEEVRGAVGGAEDPASPFLLPATPAVHGRAAFDILDRLEKEIYNARTFDNREADSKAKTAKELFEAYPHDAESVSGELESLRAALTAAEQSRAVALAAAESAKEREAKRIEDESAALLRDAKAERETAEREARTVRDEIVRKADEDLRIAEGVARARYEQAAKEIADAVAEERPQVDAAEREAREAAEQEYGPAIDDLRKRIGATEQKAEEASRTRENRKIAAKMAEDAERFRTSSRAKTEALDRLKGLRGSLLEGCPIPGVEVRDGRFYVDGVHFDLLNEAQRMALGVKVALLRRGTCPLLVIDGIECLDEEAQASLFATLRESGVQAIMTKVSSVDPRDGRRLGPEEFVIFEVPNEQMEA